MKNHKHYGNGSTPANQSEYQINKNWHETNISRILKDWFDFHSVQSKPSAVEFTRNLRDIFAYEYLIEQFQGLPNGDEIYHDEVTDAHDRLRVMYGYNYDQIIEGEHLSRIQQQYGFD